MLHVACCILTKAFDTVDHAKLLNNMYHTFGIRGVANQFVESYLSDRKQYTKVFNKSKMVKITHGVRQGSSSGPLLFLFYVYDFPVVKRV